MIAWGIVSTLTATTTTFGGLVACRLFLGLIEAAYFVGLPTETLVVIPRQLMMPSPAVYICYLVGILERRWSNERRCSIQGLSYPAPSRDSLRLELLRISMGLEASRHGDGFSSLKEA